MSSEEKKPDGEKSSEQVSEGGDQLQSNLEHTDTTSEAKKESAPSKLSGANNEGLQNSDAGNSLKTWEEGRSCLSEILYRKVGSSRLFDDEGNEHHVTILKREDAFIVGVRSLVKHGYSAIQVGIQPTEMFKVNKPQRGLFRKVGIGAFKQVVELKLNKDLGNLSPEFSANVTDKGVLGSKVPVPGWVTEGAFIDVIGKSKGRGFTGVLKRHNMSGPPATRGTHEARRNVGSIGCRKYPGKVFKGKRLPGHYGDERVTVLNLKVIKVLDDGEVLAIKGAVPGYNGGLVRVRPAVMKMAGQTHLVAQGNR